MEEQECIPTTSVSINITHEEVQNLAHMKSENEAFEHLRIWYGIDTSRILFATTISEPSMRPVLILKLKQA
jgi:hypothetical protein